MSDDEKLLDVEEKSLYAMAKSDRITVEQALVIVLLEGEIMADVQICGTCKPKRSTLTAPGSNVYVPPDAIYRLHCNQMVRARYLVIHRKG